MFPAFTQYDTPPQALQLLSCLGSVPPYVYISAAAEITVAESRAEVRAHSAAPPVHLKAQLHH